MIPERYLAHIALLVADYDEAIRFYTEALQFQLLEDRDLGGGKRWVRVAPNHPHGAALLLAKAVTPAQIAAIGDQSGGRVFLFLYTNDFERDYRHMRASGVVFLEEPRHESYGIVAVFRDLYGNRWDLLQPFEGV